MERVRRRRAGLRSDAVCTEKIGERARARFSSTDIWPAMTKLARDNAILFVERISAPCEILSGELRFKPGAYGEVAGVIYVGWGRS